MLLASAVALLAGCAVTPTGGPSGEDGGIPSGETDASNGDVDGGLVNTSLSLRGQWSCVAPPPNLNPDSGASTGGRVDPFLAPLGDRVLMVGGVVGNRFEPLKRNISYEWVNDSWQAEHVWDWGNTGTFWDASHTMLPDDMVAVAGLNDLDYQVEKIPDYFVIFSKRAARPIDLPFEPRLHPAIGYDAATRRIVMWGGHFRFLYEFYRDGAYYNILTGESGPLPAPPEEVTGGDVYHGWDPGRRRLYILPTIQTSARLETFATGVFAAFDASTDTWRLLPDFPSAQRLAHSVSLAGKFFVWASEMATGRSFVQPSETELWVFDPEGNVWRELEPSPWPVNGAAGIADNGRYIFIAGWVFDGQEEMWTDLCSAGDCADHLVERGKPTWTPTGVFWWDNRYGLGVFSPPMASFFRFEEAAEGSRKCPEGSQYEPATGDPRLGEACLFPEEQAASECPPDFPDYWRGYHGDEYHACLSVPYEGRGYPGQWNASYQCPR